MLTTPYQLGRREESGAATPRRIRDPVQGLREFLRAGCRMFAEMEPG